jgi:hypothetical protein
MVTKRALRSISMPCLASLYKGALQKVKRLFFAKKAGHTGALDPLASGILPICLGQATQVAGFLLKISTLVDTDFFHQILSEYI